MSFLLKVVQALCNAFCGPSEQQPSQQTAPHQAQPQYSSVVQQQQQQYPSQHQPHPQWPSHQQQQHPQYQRPSHPQQEHRPAHVTPQPPHSPKPHSPRPDYQDPNQFAHRRLQESHEAYSRGDGAGAKDLSNQGKEHQRKMEELNKEASDWIFIENNKDSKPGEIDLHGLYVKEAIMHTDRAVEEAKRRGDSEIHLIVGKGLHSKGGVAKLKPAIEELMDKHRLVAELDPHNAGVLIVLLNTGRDRGVGPDEITRRLDRDDEACVIM
ncbi:hypothetical protein D9758_001870 [Tetrapyrgos nigripes]|uniref:Smr domain-containing protein n=1 Tax=Tetrapyrgos nigripes TaxID=182062 RepID=A0A8H5LV60_9AGAR|nr:hypothetical protein D9758_001870 [Tetrapyrgos nigripes]